MIPNAEGADFVMMDIALCIGTEHDPWLVLVAVLICCAGAFSVAQIFERIRSTSGPQRLGWIFLTAIAAGATIWCTHFVAMIAYRVHVPVHIDPVLTIVSLIIAIAGTSLALLIATRRASSLPLRLIGGGLLGAAIAGMHFTGMVAYRVDGIVDWRMNYVVASVLCAIGFGAAAIVVLGSPVNSRYRMATGTALLVTAIATLHFTAMTALRITPLALSTSPLSREGLLALALATALVGAMVIIAGIAATLIDRQTRSDAMQQLHHMAMNDALTGLPNRASFQQEVRRQISITRATGTMLAVIAIDLNRFKEINDLHGHKAGDTVLATLSGRMQEKMEADEMVARLGGDEFVALSRFSDPSRLTRLVERLNELLREPVDHGEFCTQSGASIGVAIMPNDAQDAETLSNNADLAMYRAKKEGAVVARYYDATLDEAIRTRRELANDLRIAMEKGELELHYQLQAAIDTRQVTGYEALLRWSHPVRGSVPPSEFIPIAEENGLILALGEWVLRRACRDAAGWKNESKVAINVSPLQLAHADLPRLFHQVLLETGLPPRRLEIELTESALMTDRERSLHILRQIKALGVSVALDDFGTGYSSLETLRTFPFDKIKLDRFFISGLEDPQSTAIIRAVLALGKSLSIPVLAEGIETEGQLEMLLREGCDEVQGFLLGHPAPMDTAAPADDLIAIAETPAQEIPSDSVAKENGRRETTEDRKRYG